MTIVKIFFLIVLLTILAAGLFIGSGAYNIAANVPHWPVTTKLLEIVRERSIEVRSEDLPPAPKTSPEMLSEAAEGYAEMCVQCHLAPGVEETELYQGLYPKPPVFYKEQGEEHDEKEMFWVIKNGIKLTAMPSWGAVHTDEQMWALVRFLEKLPDMSPQEYRGLTAEDATHTSEERGHSDGHKSEGGHHH